MSLLTYDPNDASHVDTVHVVKIKVQQWEYTKEYTVKIAGCLIGASVLGHAISQVVNEIIGEDEPDKYTPVIIELTHKDDTLQVDLNEDEDPEWYFKKMIVALEIVGIEYINPKPARHGLPL